MSICQSISRGASNPLLWKYLSEIIGKIFVETATVKELVSISEQVNPDILKVICYHGVGVVGSLKQAAQFQKAIVAYLEMFKGQAEHNRIMIPYIVDYWDAKFKRQRFNFISPKLFENEFNAIICSSPETIINCVINLANQHL